jgi:hypothetical protein
MTLQDKLQCNKKQRDLCYRLSLLATSVYKKDVMYLVKDFTWDPIYNDIELFVEDGMSSYDFITKN